MEVFDKFGTNKAEMKETHAGIKGKVMEMGVFQQAGKLLNDVSESDLEPEIKRIVGIYEDLKASIQCLFFYLRPSFQAENSRELEDFLDEHFYRQVLDSLKPRLTPSELITGIYHVYDRNYGVSLLSRPRSLLSQVWGSNYNKETLFCGELVDGVRSGYGRMMYSSGDWYEGYWKSDRYDGKGVYVWRDRGSYEGDFDGGKMHGHGTRLYASGARYVGKFEEGRKHGSGHMFFATGDEYDGEWTDDYMHGQGTYTWSTGGIYTGNFVKDRREGKGKLVLGEEVHEGDWASGRLVRRQL